jgi:tRNA nucleotidyltransferase (CCA-adding enzyme)
MVHNGELDALQPERIYTETLKALAESDPVAYFAVLQQTDALGVVYPEVACAMPKRPVLDVLAETVRLTQAASPQASPIRRATKDEARLRFIALAQACGEPTEAPQPCSRCTSLCRRLRAPRMVESLARRACGVRHALCHWQDLDADLRLAHLERLDAWRSKEQVVALGPVLLAELTVCGAPSHQWEALLKDMSRALDVPTQPLVQQGLKGEALGKALRQARLAALAERDHRPADPV